MPFRGVFYAEGFPAYVSVGGRRATAAWRALELARGGQTLEPVKLRGRTIAATFWGKAWCTHLDTYSDYANRLPRGRTYLRSGAVIDLRIERGMVRALVSGSDVYTVNISIRPLSKAHSKRIAGACAGQIESVLDLLRGQLPAGIMRVLTHETDGLFPEARALKMACSCPDYAVMCKHVSAALYGIGARLDKQPELLFVLRGVEQEQLVARAAAALGRKQALRGGKGKSLDAGKLSTVFGIELEGHPARPGRRVVAGRAKAKGTKAVAKRPINRAATK